MRESHGKLKQSVSRLQRQIEATERAGATDRDSATRLERLREKKGLLEEQTRTLSAAYNAESEAAHRAAGDAAVLEQQVTEAQITAGKASEEFRRLEQAARETGGASGQLESLADAAERADQRTSCIA